MYRFLSALLVLVLLFSYCAFAEEGPKSDHLDVGNPTPMRGDFFTELWMNSTSDIDVRSLLHGYSLIYWNGNIGMYAHDPTVVRDIHVTANKAGDHLCTFVLYNDLYYSDGTKITARDYAFSILLQISPELREIGASPVQWDYISGMEEYLNGSAFSLTGVRVKSDTRLEITIRHEFLPFFYEMGLMMYNPYPIHVIAPGVEVRDDGKGVYLANIDENVNEPVFTADLLRKTILDPETGYKSHPSVVSGPYTLTSWDGEKAEFAINPRYKGNRNDVKPSISTLTYSCADNATMISDLENGKFGLLNKVMKADSIAKGEESVRSGFFASTEYPRMGCCFLSFACEKDTVSSEKVRQAIAWCLDRDELTKEYCGNYGTRVDGYYGIGQWMYRVLTGAVSPLEEPNPSDTAAVAAYEEAMAAFKALSLDNLTVYTANLDEARRLLDEDGWKLNEEGIREKRINDQTVTLDLTLVYPDGNNVTDILEKLLVPNLEAVGIRLAMKSMPMPELLGVWGSQEERDADIYYLANNFTTLFDPSANFITEEAGDPSWSFTRLQDKKLYELALDMRRTVPGDLLGYMQKWIAFQERFNEILPTLPVYSNLYYDFYTEALCDYAISAYIDWGEAIVPAYFSNEATEE